MDIITDKYMWWYGTSDDRFDTQHNTREDAIAHGREMCSKHDKGFYICEAITPSVKISNYLDFDLLLEHVNEQCFDNHGDPDGDGDMLSVTNEQSSILSESIRELVDKWQSNQSITVSSWQFSHSRNKEFIPVK